MPRKLKPRQGPMELPFPKYPVGREAWYFGRYMPYVLRMGVAMDFGAEASLLLVAVCWTEHKTNYQKSVRFWNSQLTAYCGCSEDKLASVRRKLAQAGWLHYTPGRKSVSGIYWVLVPGGDDQLRDSMLGDNGEFVPAASGDKPGENREKAGEQSGNKPGHSYLDSSIKDPPSEEWRGAAEIVELSGLKKCDEAIRTARAHDLQPSDVLTLVEWWKSVKHGFRSPHGALFHAMTTTRPQSLENIRECFPPLDPAVAASLATSARQARELDQRRNRTEADAAEKKRSERERQLLLVFEPELRDLTVSAIIERYPIPEDVRDSLSGFSTWKSMDRSPKLRLAVLEAVASAKRSSSS